MQPQTVEPPKALAQAVKWAGFNHQCINVKICAHLNALGCHDYQGETMYRLGAVPACNQPSAMGLQHPIAIQWATPACHQKRGDAKGFGPSTGLACSSPEFIEHQPRNPDAVNHDKGRQTLTDPLVVRRGQRSKDFVGHPLVTLCSGDPQRRQLGGVDTPGDRWLIALDLPQAKRRQAARRRRCRHGYEGPRAR
jgi:hypothetical protein